MRRTLCCMSGVGGLLGCASVRRAALKRVRGCARELLVAFGYFHFVRAGVRAYLQARRAREQRAAATVVLSPSATAGE